MDFSKVKGAGLKSIPLQATRGPFKCYFGQLS